MLSVISAQKEKNYVFNTPKKKWVVQEAGRTEDAMEMKLQTDERAG